MTTSLVEALRTEVKQNRELLDKYKVVVVVFDMWGQRCETKFDATSELNPLTWIGRMVDKGWMLPVEVLSPDGVVLFDLETLRAMFEEQ